MDEWADGHRQQATLRAAVRSIAQPASAEGPKKPRHCTPAGDAHDREAQTGKDCGSGTQRNKQGCELYREPSGADTRAEGKADVGGAGLYSARALTPARLPCTLRATDADKHTQASALFFTWKHTCRQLADSTGTSTSFGESGTKGKFILLKNVLKFKHSLFITYSFQELFEVFLLWNILNLVTPLINSELKTLKWTLAHCTSKKHPQSLPHFEVTNEHYLGNYSYGSCYLWVKGFNIYEARQLPLSMPRYTQNRLWNLKKHLKYHITTKTQRTNLHSILLLLILVPKICNYYTTLDGF